MARTLYVSGQITIADGGAVTGTLSVSGGTDTDAGTVDTGTVDAGTPDVITDGGGAPTVTDPPAADMPPNAPDVPAGEAPTNPVDPAGTEPVDPAGVGAGVDPTAAGAEAGTDAGSGADTPAGPPFPGHDLHRDDTQHNADDDVRAWQQAATDAGYTVGKVDGYFGPRTEAAVVKAQQDALIGATGVIDAATWALPFTADA